MSEQQEKMKALKQTIERLEKTYGKGVVMKMDDTRSVAVDVISTGSFGLDLALGVGGFPGEELLRFTVLKVAVKPPSPCTPSQRHRKKAAFALSSMQNMRLIKFMPKTWASTRPIC